MAAALLGFEAIIDLRPEGAEVIDCRPNREQNNHPECDLPGGVDDRILAAKDEQRDGGNLRTHLELAKFRGVDRETLRGRDAAEAADGEFPALTI